MIVDFEWSMAELVNFSFEGECTIPQNSHRWNEPIDPPGRKASSSVSHIYYKGGIS